MFPKVRLRSQDTLASIIEPPGPKGLVRVIGRNVVGEGHQVAVGTTNIKRCEAPCVGYVSKEDYRAGIDGVIAFLSGRYKEIEQRLEFEMNQAAAEQRYEDAARERNRLQAVSRLLERQRVVGRAGRNVRRDRGRGGRGRGQRAGAAGPRRRAVGPPELLSRQRRRRRPRRGHRGVHHPVLRRGDDDPAAGGGRARHAGCRAARAGASERRGARVEVREAERGDKRRILELAQRNARLALDQEKLRSERRRQQRTEALDRLQQALGLDTLPLRIECYDISTLMGTNTVASMVVFEGAAPKKSDYRRFKVRTVGDAAANAGAPGPPAPATGRNGDYGPDDFAAMEEILGRRMAQFEAQEDRSPHDKEYDPSFAALPNLIVIDGGKGQLSAGLRALAGFRRAGRDRDLAGQADRGGVHPWAGGVAGAAARHAGAAAAAAGAR